MNLVYQITKYKEDQLKTKENLISINKLKENKIEIVYIIKSLWRGNDFFENGLSKNCYTKKEITEVLDSYLLQQCKELNN